MHVERSAMDMDVPWRPRGNVIPAEAGIQRLGTSWMPAYAAMTIPPGDGISALRST